jgi:cephalosporin-C deacetylase-like acetyl esterase
VPFFGSMSISVKSPTATSILVLLLCLCCAAQHPATGSAALQPPAKDNPMPPSVAIDDLKLQEALVGEHDDYPTFTRDMIQVTWRTGDHINLTVILPKGHTKPPVILYLYSYPSETERFLNDNFCRFLAQGGFAAVGFVSALTGQRYHDRPMKEWFVSELPEAIANSVQDVQMLLNYLTGRGDVDVSRAGMFGEGSGAAIAILAAAKDSRIMALDLVDPWGDWPDWLAKSTLVPGDERTAYVKPEFLQKAAPFDPIRWLGRIKVPVRLQYLSNPEVTPQSARDRIVAAAPSQAVVIPRTSALEQYKTARLKFFDWIKDQLRPASEQ